MTMVFVAMGLCVGGSCVCACVCVCVCVCVCWQKLCEDGLNQPIFNFGYMAEDLFLE